MAGEVSRVDFRARWLAFTAWSRGRNEQYRPTFADLISLQLGLADPEPIHVHQLQVNR